MQSRKVKYGWLAKGHYWHRHPHAGVDVDQCHPRCRRQYESMSSPRRRGSPTVRRGLKRDHILALRQSMEIPDNAAHFRDDGAGLEGSHFRDDGAGLEGSHFRGDVAGLIGSYLRGDGAGLKRSHPRAGGDLRADERRLKRN